MTATVTTPVGRLVPDEEGVRLESVRTFPEPVEEVWSALTEPDRLARWFGRWTGDPATGTVDVVMTAEDDDTPQRVRIDECEPPTRLAVELPTSDGPWPLSATLRGRDGGCELTFVHRLAEPYDASSIGPGWQYYLDRLAAVVAGTPVPERWEDYYPALSDAYAVPPAP